jgi:hypothetical protein
MQFYMKHLPIAAVLAGLVFFFSCTEKEDTSKVVESYGLIYSSFIAAKGAQQKFVDKVAESINTVKYDKDAPIDTTELALLLENAKTANTNCLLEINLAHEIDGKIRYKAKGLQYVFLLDTLYRNEFKEYLTVIAAKADNRFENASKLLLPRLKELKELGEACAHAGAEIRTKYNIEILTK